MFFKKLFYKVTNKETYNEYKVNLEREKRLKWYKSGYQNQIIDIQKKIDNKKELNFLHGGQLGDIVDSLALIKKLSETHKCKLYLDVDNKNKSLKFKNHVGKAFLNDKMVNMLMPLLKKQSFIDSVNIHKGEDIDINLNLFREIHTKMNMSSTRWYFYITGVHADLSLPYLFVEQHKKIKNKITIIRSMRRNSIFINYKFLNNYKDLLFIGLESEFKLLKDQIPNLDFYNCENFLEMAEIIRSSKFFLGNITLGYCIAEAMKVPRLLECSHDGDLAAIHPSGQNAYDFFFQEHFEKWFDYLYNL
jgi:virulence-associated protein VapD